jgi:hypothetical protein
MITTQHDEIEEFQGSVRSGEISPELVLVDPELAQIARAALREEAEARPAPREDAEKQAALRAISREFERQTERPVMAPSYYEMPAPPSVAANATRRERRQEPVVSRPSRLLSLTGPSILTASLLLNLMLAGVLLGGSGETPSLEPPAISSNSASTTRVQEGTTIAPRLGAQTQTRASTQVAATHRTLRARHASKGPHATHEQPSRTKAAAERSVLALVQAAPSSRVAPLIDSKSGLLKNNVQAICRRQKARSLVRFLCIVRPYGAARGAGLYIRYTLAHGGRWSVTWLGYRKGSASAAEQVSPSKKGR